MTVESPVFCEYLQFVNASTGSFDKDQIESIWMDKIKKAEAVFLTEERKKYLLGAFVLILAAMAVLMLFYTVRCLFSFHFPGQEKGKSLKNIHNKNEWLRWASERGELTLVKRLILAGADVNSGDEQKKSPLTLAAEKQHYPVCKYLIPFTKELIVQKLRII